MAMLPVHVEDPSVRRISSDKSLRVSPFARGSDLSSFLSTFFTEKTFYQGTACCTRVLEWVQLATVLGQAFEYIAISAKGHHTNLSNQKHS